MTLTPPKTMENAPRRAHRIGRLCQSLEPSRETLEDEDEDGGKGGGDDEVDANRRDTKSWLPDALFVVVLAVLASLT